FAALAVGLERSHSQPLELRAIGIIHLEVQRVIGKECEKQLAGIDADSAEHGTCAQLRHNTTQLINDECAEARTDRHTVIRFGGGRLTRTFCCSTIVLAPPNGSRLSCVANLKCSIRVRAASFRRLLGGSATTPLQAALRLKSG